MRLPRDKEGKETILQEAREKVCLLLYIRYVLVSVHPKKQNRMFIHTHTDR